MRNDSPHERVPRQDPQTFFHHFHQSRQPLPAKPPPRPWLPGSLTLLCAMLVIIGSMGPWTVVREMTPDGPETIMIHGTRSDGVFSILFAMIALAFVCLLLIRPGATFAGWVAVGAMVMCTAVGFFDWVLFAPADTGSGGFVSGDVLSYEWGVRVVFLAGVAGIISSFITARDVTGE